IKVIYKTVIKKKLKFLHSYFLTVTHSLKYFYTSFSQVPNFPEFVVVGLVDDVQMIYYDSNTKRAEPKQDWMSRVTESKDEYWEWNTEGLVGQQQLFKGNIEISKQRVHILQMMEGCEWDDETGSTNGFNQHGYDGEDFIVFDMRTETWIAPKPQAVLTKHKWDNNKAWIARKKHYYTQICPEWLKMYLTGTLDGIEPSLRLSISAVLFLL
uniref:MHC class I-like antigen recognition-like domain-containing protein n=1 Tax=Sander lucioperca TaxID=283035 RepID=A0A8C9XB30_SANLU